MAGADDIPRRFRLGDPGCTLRASAGIAVFLDGEKMTDLMGWDCDAGTVERYVFDEEGSLIVFGEIDGDGAVISGRAPAPVTEILEGLVEVRRVASTGSA